MAKNITRKEGKEMSDYDEEILKKCNKIFKTCENKTIEEIAIACYKLGYNESASDLLLYLKEKNNK